VQPYSSAMYSRFESRVHFLIKSGKHVQKVAKAPAKQRAAGKSKTGRSKASAKDSNAKKAATKKAARPKTTKSAAAAGK
jgi:hypothetical protein